MLTNADITIYNQVVDSTTRKTTWKRSVLHGVHAFVDVKATLVNQSGRPGNESVFRIPDTCDKYPLYIPEKDYYYLVNKGSYWTLATGDLVVLGVCNLDINGINTLESNHIKAFRMSAISDNRRGMNPHLRVRCE